MALMLKNARLIDPQIGLDEVADILIRDGKIVEVGHDLTMEKGVERDSCRQDRHPGLVDMHVHFRDPGQEQKRGHRLWLPCGGPRRLHRSVHHAEHEPGGRRRRGRGICEGRARGRGKCRVVVAGACSKDLKGEVLSDMGDMYAHGAPVFTDDGHGIQDAGMMRRVMDYANQFDTVIMAHCQDDSLVGRRPGERGRGERRASAWWAGRPRARELEIAATSRCAA